jgi:hypothetical protein
VEWPAAVHHPQPDPDLRPPSRTHDPTEPARQLAAARAQRAELEARREHLRAGTGPYQDTQIGRLAQHRRQLDADLADARHRLDDARPWQQRSRRKALHTMQQLDRTATGEWRHIGQPEATRLERQIYDSVRQVLRLEAITPGERPHRALTEDERAQERSFAQTRADLDQTFADIADDHGRQLDDEVPVRSPELHARIDRTRARLARYDTPRPDRDDGLGLGL